MSASSWVPPQLKQPLAVASARTRLWLVGGAVRDRILGRETKDFDFAVEHDTQSIARLIADKMGGKYYLLDSARDIGRVLLPPSNGPGYCLDFGSLRGSDITEDLKSRDFSINALAVEFNKPDQVLDPVGGGKDLHGKLIRACRPDSIENDPVRALRAIRLALALNFRLDPGTLKQVQAAEQMLLSVSAERNRDEFFRILALHRPGSAVRLLDRIHFIPVLFPELASLREVKQPRPPKLGAWEHTLALLDRLSELLDILGDQHDPEGSADLISGETAFRLGRFRSQISGYLNQEMSYGRNIRQLLYFCGLYHASGEAEDDAGREEPERHERISAEFAQNRALAMRLSTGEQAWIGQVILHHQRPAMLALEAEVSKRAVYRFFRHCGQAGVGAILLSLADLSAQTDTPVDQDAWAKRIQVARRLLGALYEQPPEALDPPRIIRGDELAAALGIEPGPMLGELLEIIREEQAANAITTREEAISLAQKQLEQTQRDRPPGE